MAKYAFSVRSQLVKFNLKAVSFPTGSVPHKRGCRFQHPAGIKLMLPAAIILALTTKPEGHINLEKNFVLS